MKNWIVRNKLFLRLKVCKQKKVYLWEIELFEIEQFLYLSESKQKICLNQWLCKQKTVLMLNWIVWNRTVFEL